MRWVWLQLRMSLLAVVLVLFLMAAIALAAGELSDGRIGIGLGSIVLFLLSVANGYFGWDQPDPPNRES